MVGTQQRKPLLALPSPVQAHARMHTQAHTCTHATEGNFHPMVFPQWRFLSLASAALSFPPHHSQPLPSWRLGSAREQRKPLSWWKNHHSNMALSPALKGLSHAWLLVLAQMKHMKVFLMAQSVVTLSSPFPLSGSAHTPGLCILL